MNTIAIFDSGVGGLSVYREIVKVCGKQRYLFISDNAGFPYGSKGEVELLERVQEVVAAIDKAFSPDLLVIACNTASTVALPSLRALYSFPIVGVVPAIKPAANLSNSNVIGVLATPATVKRRYTHQLIEEFAPNCEVITIGSEALVKMAEKKMAGEPINLNVLRNILSPFLNHEKLDVLVLACTHYPLLNKEISYFFKEEKHVVTLLDSGEAIAKRVLTLLNEKHDTRPLNKRSNLALFTESIEGRNLNATLKFEFGFEKIQVLAV